MNVILVANWKMHPMNLRAAKVLVSATKKAVGTARGLSVIIAPPAIFLRDVAKSSRSSKVSYAAQNVSAEREGAYTGEISIPMALDSGASHVLIGHSEVRSRGESNYDTRRKVKAVLDAKLTPILCVGESVRDDEGEYLKSFSEQVLEGLADVPKATLKNVLIAYEPVWAIGHEKPMDPHMMHETVLYIRKILLDKFGKPAMSVPILYGGSITEDSAREMIEEGDVQGLLVGHVSVNPVRFADLIKTLRK